jgi:hypothetical protein
MGRILFIIVCLLWSVSISQAQVVPGTVNSKTLDGVGNKITSTVVGADLGLDVNCLNCGGAGGVSDINIMQILGVAPSATNWLPGRLTTGTTYYDARDRNWTLSSGTDSVTATVSNAFLLDATFTGRINTLGQKTMAASTPVVLASDQTSIPTSSTVTNAFLLDATFTGRFAAAFLDADAIANQTTTAVHGFGYMFNGATWDRVRGTIAGGLLVNISNATLAVTQSGVWSVGRTWALSAGSDSINLSQFGGAAVSLGGQITAASIPVNIATDQVPVAVKYSTVSSANNDGACPSGAANFTVAASNASRTWIAIWASPANTDDVYIKLGVTATSADGRIAPGQPINFTAGRIYTGQIDAFPNSGTQAVCLMELN